MKNKVTYSLVFISEMLCHDHTGYIVNYICFCIRFMDVEQYIIF